MGVGTCPAVRYLSLTVARAFAARGAHYARAGIERNVRQVSHALPRHLEVLNLPWLPDDSTWSPAPLIKTRTPTAKAARV